MDYVVEKEQFTRLVPSQDVCLIQIYKPKFIQLKEVVKYEVYSGEIK